MFSRLDELKVLAEAAQVGALDQAPTLLVEVCRRAAAAGGSAPTTPKAAVVVTMDHQDLKDRFGAGTTLTGDLPPPAGRTGTPSARHGAKRSAGSDGAGCTRTHGTSQPATASRRLT